MYHRQIRFPRWKNKGWLDVCHTERGMFLSRLKINQFKQKHLSLEERLIEKMWTFSDSISHLLTKRCGLRETVSNLQLTKWPFSSMVDRASVKNQCDRLLRKKSRWFGRKSTHKQFCSDYPDIQIVPFRGKVSSEQWDFLHMQPFSSTYAQPWLTTESTAYVSFKVLLRGTHADPEQSLLFECHEHAAAAWNCSPRPTNLHRHQVPEKRSSRQWGSSSLCP